MDRNLKSFSNQFPVCIKNPKKKAISYTLQYDGVNIPGALYAPWVVCHNLQEDMIKAGSHKREKFKIEPNY